MSRERIVAGLLLAFLWVGACERPQDRPLKPDLPAPEPIPPTNIGDPDADTGRTIGPIADVNAAAQAGSFGQAGTFGLGGSAQGGTVGSGAAAGMPPGTGGRSIHERADR